jgi:3-oxoacyl-[acyl-carrier-protein] synthase-1
MRRVVVTGIGIVSSIGGDAAEVSAALKAAQSGVVAAPAYAELGFRCQVHATPKLPGGATEWETLVDRRAARFLAPGTAYAHIAMEQAIKDSGLTESEIQNERTGLIVGDGGPSTRAIINAAEITKEKGPKRVGPFAVPKAMCSGPSAVLSTWYKTRGINYSISSACATSTHCIGAGAEQIIMGKQDVVFAGGCEELDWSLSVLFDAMGAMSSGFNDRPAVASRAYDRDRDGFVIAGGAGIVVLEEYEHAKARGAKIYAEVVGYAANADAHDMVAPSGEGAVRCMRLAMKGMDGSGDVGRIDYLNPHGTGTPIGDAKEMDAVRTVFGKDMPLISSTKSLTGHSLGAAGAWEAIFCMLMMQDDFAAKSAHIDNLDDAFADMPILLERKDNAKLETVMSNSFGFGGTNGALVMRRV